MRQLDCALTRTGGGGHAAPRSARLRAPLPQRFRGLRQYQLAPLGERDWSNAPLSLRYGALSRARQASLRSPKPHANSRPPPPPPGPQQATSPGVIASGTLPALALREGRKAADRNDRRASILLFTWPSLASSPGRAGGQPGPGHREKQDPFPAHQVRLTRGLLLRYGDTPFRLRLLSGSIPRTLHSAKHHETGHDRSRRCHPMAT